MGCALHPRLTLAPPTTPPLDPHVSRSPLFINPHLIPPPPPFITSAMAASPSPSSSQDPLNPLSVPSAAASSRRLPPPCWSHDETVGLIDAYRDKWYSLRRGNLRASHWQEVADGVAARCPPSAGNPPKTSTQCRHKMEKLRKRYRAEIQRVSAAPKGHRFPSSWVHFKLMDAMELGANSSDLNNQDDDEEEDEKDDDNQDDLLLYPRGIKQAIPLPSPLNQRFYGSNNGNGNGVRIKIPGAQTPAPALPLPRPQAGSYDDYPPPTNRRYGSGQGSRDGYMKECFGIEKERGGRRREEVAEEMVEAVKMLGDGYARTERMKMEMARELESMRMEMEMKRTEMILESQQRLVDSFSKAVLEQKNKKAKRMPTPES